MAAHSTSAIHTERVLQDHLIAQLVSGQIDPNTWNRRGHTARALDDSEHTAEAGARPTH